MKIFCLEIFRLYGKNYFLLLFVDIWQGAIVLLDIIFVIRGPGFPCRPNPEEAQALSEDGYINFPDQDASSGNYEPPEP